MTLQQLGRLLDEHYPTARHHLIHCRCGWEGMDWSAHFYGVVPSSLFAESPNDLLDEIEQTAIAEGH